MANLNVSVSDPMFDWVQQRVESGQYSTVSDYFRDLISRDQDAENSTMLSVDDIRRSIEKGRLEGTIIPAEEVFQRIIKKISDLNHIA